MRPPYGTTPSKSFVSFVSVGTANVAQHGAWTPPRSNQRRNGDVMREQPKSGFFRDDGTEVNPNLIAKPSLCVSCRKDDDPRRMPLRDWWPVTAGAFSLGELSSDMIRFLRYVTVLRHRAPVLIG